MFTQTQGSKGNERIPMKVLIGMELVDRVVRLTERQLEILRRLYHASVPMTMQSVIRTQAQLAKELRITRQALSSHLRKLRTLKLIRTGRGFIDLSPDCLRILGKSTDQALVFLKVQPKYRVQVLEELKQFRPLRIHRVTGSVDIVAIVGGSELPDFLTSIADTEGVIETSTHTILTTWTPETT